MTTATKVLRDSAWLAAAIAATTGLAIPPAKAYVLNVDSDAVGKSGSPDNLNFTNTTVTGNIVIGDTDRFVGTAPGTVNGTVEFAAPNTGQFQPNGVVVTGGASFGNADVQTTLNDLVAMSQSFRNEGGTSRSIVAGGSLNASDGILDSGGNEVFTAAVDSSFATAGTTFTINGTSSQFVVINTITGGHAFNGSIVLTGGITSDHVLFNFDAGNYETLSGGDALMMDTGGRPTTGTFLDPNGPYQITDTMLAGRIFGGDSEDSGITNSTITAPVPAPRIGEPISAGLVGAGLIALRIFRRRQGSPARS